MLRDIVKEDHPSPIVMEVGKGCSTEPAKPATTATPATTIPPSDGIAPSVTTGSHAASPRQDADVPQAEPSGDAGFGDVSEVACGRPMAPGDSIQAPERIFDLAILQMMYTDLMLSHQALAASHRVLLSSLHTSQLGPLGPLGPFSSPYGPSWYPPPGMPPPSYFDPLHGAGYDAYGGACCGAAQDVPGGMPPGSTWFTYPEPYAHPGSGPHPWSFRDMPDLADAGAPTGFWGPSFFPTEDDKPQHPPAEHARGHVHPPMPAVASTSAAVPPIHEAAPSKGQVSSPTSHPAQVQDAHPPSSQPAPQAQRVTTSPPASARPQGPSQPSPQPPQAPQGGAEAPPAPPQEVRQRHAHARPGLGGLLGGQPQGAPANGVAPGGHAPAVGRRQVPERLAGLINVRLMLKLAVLVFIMTQDGSRQKLLFWCLAACLIYLYQIGAMMPLRRWLMVVASPAVRVVPGAPGAAGVNAGAAGANNPPGPRTLGGIIFGALWELQVLVLGFFTSLLPGWNVHEVVPAGGAQRPAVPPAVAAARAGNNGRPRDDDREHQD